MFYHLNHLCDNIMSSCWIWKSLSWSGWRSTDKQQCGVWLTPWSRDLHDKAENVDVSRYLRTPTHTPPKLSFCNSFWLLMWTALGIRWPRPHLMMRQSLTSSTTKNSTTLRTPTKNNNPFHQPNKPPTQSSRPPKSISSHSQPLSQA